MPKDPAGFTGRPKKRGFPAKSAAFVVFKRRLFKKKSEIEKESRVTVALNRQKAQEAEIESTKEVEVKQAVAAQASGEAMAKSEQAVGIAKQHAEQAIAEESKVTAEKTMAVSQVNTVRGAEIEKEKQTVTSVLNRLKILATRK